MYMQDIDYRAELEKYSWTRPKWSSDKLIAAAHSVMTKRQFFVNLTGEYAGCFGDSGAYDGMGSGNFTNYYRFYATKRMRKPRNICGMSTGIRLTEPIPLR
jgi:hypothetical protein